MSHLQKPKIGHIILAAGRSSRMGSPKQLLPWKDTTLIGHAVQEALKLQNTEVFVILGAYFESIHEQICHFPVRIIRNLDWEKGMGTSIKKGIGIAMQDELGYDAVLISLVDQPLLDGNHYEMLFSKFRNHPDHIIATELNERIGVPGIFPVNYFNELFQLNADYGARHIITNNKDYTLSISAKNRGVDIDTIQEYRAIVQEKS